MVGIKLHRPSRKLNKLERGALKFQNELIHGTVLAIDPSSGSKKSVPGFAIYENSKLVEAGQIEFPVPPETLELHEKCQMIAQILLEEFEVPDILVIEYIPPKIGGGTTKSVVSLHQGIGAILAGVRTPNKVEVAAMSWRKFIDEDYEKNDANDAILIGYAAIDAAYRVTNTPRHNLKLKYFK